MIDEARLRSLDDELAGLGVDAAKLEAVLARARAARSTLAEADEALGALGGGIDTRVAGDAEERISVEISVETASDEAGGPPESSSTEPPPAAALELELESSAAGAPAPSPEPEPERVRAATFPPPHDVEHPSPGSIVPPPPTDLDAELASILADELEGAEASGEAPLEDEMSPEPTALFSAEMFGATEEPSLDKLMSEIPPPLAEDDVEIDLDEEVVVEEAVEAAPSPRSQMPPPPSMTRPPPPPGRSVPPAAAKPGFLGRLLNKKP
jgi:hypothetical protein